MSITATKTYPAFTLEQNVEAAAFYCEFGFAVFKQVFSSKEIELAHAATDRLKNAIASDALHSRASLTVHRDQESGQARACYWGSLVESTLDHMRTDKRMLHIVEPLLGNNIRQLTNHLHWKPPGTAVSVNFHTDRVNRKPDQDFRDLGNSFVQTAVAIDPMTPDNGPLLIIPGSHRCHQEMREEGGNYNHGHPSRDILAQRGYTENDLFPVIVEAGDVALWHPDMIHGSDQNRSTIDRCIYINGYIKASSTWRGYWSFIQGQSIPVPPIDVPVAITPNSCDEYWERRFPIEN